jgi:hypothetical protein
MADRRLPSRRKRMRSVSHYCRGWLFGHSFQEKTVGVNAENLKSFD